MAIKTFYSRVPHSTFICSKGTITVFTNGKAFVEDSRVQNELDAAIKAGGNIIMTDQQYEAEQKSKTIAPAPDAKQAQ